MYIYLYSMTSILKLMQYFFSIIQLKWRSHSYFHSFILSKSQMYFNDLFLNIVQSKSMLYSYFHSFILSKGQMYFNGLFIKTLSNQNGCYILTFIPLYYLKVRCTFNYRTVIWCFTLMKEMDRYRRSSWIPVG